ncbi:SSK1, two-component response regulator activity [Serpula lacrymans var. lacrymans S7.3]|uniref:SSK1, two-component response regulator activity n=2 Tax=Serpula lacrymans var. lacrymans TaxID=341189 RepID=F8PQB9_SERL3|nr:SKN7, signal transduction response regulator [Serpula lacrymans var. lacrymans S7.9]EGO01532.1 SSK1, two-component response regulator activity [Serpula lacrymans var. lacrymans S7.3]EGO27186.1 SKN7, signal transduction response regulator [Serpula lacrymans var. lacrymans S7.9]
MPPEVMIIPKPAGPRRFLTALHTAVKKPVVDPFFAPIATSPISPGLHGVSPYLNMTQEPAPKSPSSRPVGASRTNSDRSARSPKEMMVETYNLAPPSPLGMSDSIEYFPETGVKLGASPSSGLVIQSPDGQPAGIFFHPRAKNTRSVASGGIGMERDKGQFLLPSAERPRMAVARRASDTDEHSVSFSSLHTGNVPTGYRDQQSSEGQLPASPGLKTKGKKPLSPTKEEPSHARAKPPVSPPPSRRASPMEMRKASTPPGSPSQEPSTNPPPRRSRRVHPDSHKPTSPTSASNKAKGSADANIVPPISVLIVDDNPINQTILSTFMKKKKIKFDVAKNGEEAVQKWHCGGFHLILMDIQMPVMDGIEATKEIRRLENLSASSGYTPSTPQSDLNIRTPSEAPSTESRNSVSPYRSSVIIVALTASSLQSDRVAALAAGCNDFLTKPVSLQWLNNKIIEWGSIKALQMWADLRPEVVKTISTEQTVQAQNVARRLHVPEGRVTPANSPSRSSSLARKNTISETAAQAMYKLADDSPGETPTPPVNMAAISDSTLPASSPSPSTPAENTASPVTETPEVNADTPTPEAVIPHSDVAEANGDSKQVGQSPPADLSVSSDPTPPITSQ